MIGHHYSVGSRAVICNWKCPSFPAAVVQSLSCLRLFVTPCSMPGFPVLHYLPEFAQIHAHWVGDASQPSHPLLPPSPPACNPSQHQGLFQWVDFFPSGGQSIRASVLPMNIQGWFPLGLTSLISVQSKGLSRVYSSTTIRNYQFSGTQLSLWSNSHSHTCEIH